MRLANRPELMAPHSAMALSAKSVVIVLGTRPEIIKLGHVIRLLGPAASVVHTGQHFDTGLSQTFFDAFNLPEPDAVLGVGGSTRGVQLGRVVTELDVLFRANTPTAVIVQGDTNSAAAGALAANACEIPLIHVESGLRSFDRRMPEEHNRVIADHLADLCCAPTETSRSNLRNEAIPEDRIVVTGNTVVEALRSLLPDSDARTALLADRPPSGGFVLSTFHGRRTWTNRSFWDDPAGTAACQWWFHHRVVPIAADPSLAMARRVEPGTGYRWRMSFRVCQEASVLKRPVLVVRRSTERPEVLGTFAELVPPGPGISAQALKWLDDLGELHRRLAGIPSPYGDGTASERTVAAVRVLLDG